MQSIEKSLSDAIWVAKSLFDRNKTPGSSANLSFLSGSRIYITGSGTCFGNLNPGDFAVMNLNGQHLGGCKPSKEFELHRLFYEQDTEIQAVIHIHSTYAVLQSCLRHQNPDDVIAHHTPYLEMKVGTVREVGYAPPGSEELFQKFAGRRNGSRGYLLSHHGPIVGASSVMEAFFAAEELEESAKLAWYLQNAERGEGYEVI